MKSALVWTYLLPHSGCYMEGSGNILTLTLATWCSRQRSRRVVSCCAVLPAAPAEPATKCFSCCGLLAADVSAAMSAAPGEAGLLACPATRRSADARAAPCSRAFRASAAAGQWGEETSITICLRSAPCVVQNDTIGEAARRFESQKGSGSTQGVVLCKLDKLIRLDSARHGM